MSACRNGQRNPLSHLAGKAQAVEIVMLAFWIGKRKTNAYCWGAELRDVRRGSTSFVISSENREEMCVRHREELPVNDVLAVDGLGASTRPLSSPTESLPVHGARRRRTNRERPCCRTAPRPRRRGRTTDKSCSSLASSYHLLRLNK